MKRSERHPLPREGYDFPRCRSYLHRRGIKVRMARRGVDSSIKLGRHRWVVERTISWLLRFKRLGLQPLS